jgi:hypothetical protein
MADYPEGAYDQGPIRQVEGNLVVQFDLPRPKTKYDFIMCLRIVTKTISQGTDAGDAVKTAVVAFLIHSVCSLVLRHSHPTQY